MSKKEKNHKYAHVLIEEIMHELGDRIYDFRMLGDNLKLSNLSMDVDPLTIKLIDGIYQDSLDKIFDALCNCNDMKCGEVAITALAKAMNIRRGLSKLEEV